MNFTPCHRNAELPKSRVVVRLTRQDCIERFQRIRDEYPQANEMEFRTFADRIYPEDCRLLNGSTQRIWEDTLQEFLNGIAEIKNWNSNFEN